MSDIPYDTWTHFTSGTKLIELGDRRYAQLHETFINGEPQGCTAYPATIQGDEVVTSHTPMATGPSIQAVEEDLRAATLNEGEPTNRYRYEYMRRSGRTISLPYIIWRRLPSTRRRMIERNPRPSLGGLKQFMDDK